METSDLRMTALQERQAILQRQSVEPDITGVDPGAGGVLLPLEDNSPNVKLQMRKKELQSLLQQYSTKHPHVVRLKREIDALEGEPRDTPTGKASTAVAAPVMNPLKKV